ncbi:MAG: MBL fold metallo-hydrolase [Phycisphaerales bacterium]|nr:MBL fold metallo-hydrolase [Planctomycetota bacterium]
MDLFGAEIKPATGPASLRLCVLASGSAGNCSVLVISDHSGSSFWLIDAGLSMRRTRKLLQQIGLGEQSPRGILLTHLDDDHAGRSTLDGFGEDVPVFMHKRHLGRASREGRLFRRTELLADGLKLSDSCSVHVRLAHHDTDGSASFRFTLEDRSRRAQLGYATDLGRPTAELIDHLRGVDILAIESNYCPLMQEAADRPRLVKDRVTGGSGHLSNQQCARMVRAIAPRRHVVLLHLSRQCNSPELAAREHRDAGYELFISSQTDPTPWLDAPVRESTMEPVRAATIFEM